RAIWRIDVDIDGVADLTIDGLLADEGIGRLAPTRRQWPRTQPIGEACWREGASGVLAPSAAREGGRVLAIFRPGPELTAIPSATAVSGAVAINGVTPIPPPQRFDELPAVPPGLRT